MAALPAFVERWNAKSDGRACAGCRFMDNRLFLHGEGPRPPLHRMCRRRRVFVDLSALSGAALIRVAAMVRRNGARGDELLREALERRDREQVRLGGRGGWRARRRALRQVVSQEGAAE